MRPTTSESWLFVVVMLVVFAAIVWKSTPEPVMQQDFEEKYYYSRGD